MPSSPAPRDAPTRSPSCTTSGARCAAGCGHGWRVSRPRCRWRSLRPTHPIPTAGSPPSSTDAPRPSSRSSRRTARCSRGSGPGSSAPGCCLRGSRWRSISAASPADSPSGWWPASSTGTATERRARTVTRVREDAAVSLSRAETPLGGEAVVAKSTRTRSAIIDAALGLFREKGYDATTMRAIAAEAGVSVGNAYYYFASKEQLIQGFYDRAQTDHEVAARPVLDAETDLAARIIGVTEAWLEAMKPYRPFAGKFFKNAAEPTSPLSPFSPESAPARAAAIELWWEVIDGSDAKVPKRLRAELPELLWLYFMGIVLFWVHDPTPDNGGTRTVVNRT